MNSSLNDKNNNLSSELDVTQFPKQLTIYERRELQELKSFLETDLYFYGSIMRKDYIPNKSDIDFCIFTDDVETVKYKIRHFFHMPENCFNTVIWKKKNKMIHGYKVKCKKYTEKNYEISIYETKYKDDVLTEHNKGIHMNGLLFYFLVIVKQLYYNSIINKELYIYFKEKINDVVNDRNKKDYSFLVI